MYEIKVGLMKLNKRIPTAKEHLNDTSITPTDRKYRYAKCVLLRTRS